MLSLRFYVQPSQAHTGPLPSSSSVAGLRFASRPHGVTEAIAPNSPVQSDINGAILS